MREYGEEANCIRAVEPDVMEIHEHEFSLVDPDTTELQEEALWKCLEASVNAQLRGLDVPPVPIELKMLIVEK
jgi:ABC-type Fe3+-citrate transport system substrate-binding protein